MPGVSPAGVAANGTVVGMSSRRLAAACLRFRGWDIPHLLSCSPSLHRVLLHGFVAPMGTLTSVGPLHPKPPVSPSSFPVGVRYCAAGPGPLIEQRPTLLLVTTLRPRPAPDRSPCLSRLTFRPFRLQPPPCHFATVAFARYFTAVAGRVYPPGRPFRSKGFGLRAIQGSGIPSSLPDRLGRIEFTCVTDWSFVSGCSPPFLAETQLPLSTTGR